METPIFIPLSEIAEIQDLEHDPEFTGRVGLVPKNGVLHGYSCEDIKGEYESDSNGPGKGYTQDLVCCFSGSLQHFNYMSCAMSNPTSGIILLPVFADDKYIVIGGTQHYLIELSEMASKKGYQFFVLRCDYASVPAPYYKGEISIKDCTGPELADVIFYGEEGSV